MHSSSHLSHKYTIAAQTHTPVQSTLIDLYGTVLHPMNVNAGHAASRLQVVKQCHHSAQHPVQLSSYASRTAQPFYIHHAAMS